MHPLIDRRVFQRIRGELAVRCYWEGSKREHCVSAISISGGGMKIGLPERVTPGTILDVEIFRSDSCRSSRCKGEVIWVKDISKTGQGRMDFEAGIRFIGLSLLFIACLINDLKAQRVFATA